MNCFILTVTTAREHVCHIGNPWTRAVNTGHVHERHFWTPVNTGHQDRQVLLLMTW